MHPLRRAVWLSAFCLVSCLAWAGPAQARTGTGQVLAIPGTGDSQTLLRGLAERFMLANPGVRVEVPDSIGSSGGRKAVQDGKATLARVAGSSAAREAEAGLSYLDFALTPVVFAAHPAVAGVEDITPAQALGVYSGKITDWSELGGSPGRIYPIAREAGDSSWDVLCAKLPGFAQLADPAGKTYYTTPEALRALEGHPGTLAFGPLAMFAAGRARILALSGQRPPAPGDGTAGYPLFLALGLVWRGELGALERRFAEFLRGPAAAEAIRRHSCLPWDGGPGQPHAP